MKSPTWAAWLPPIAIALSLLLFLNGCTVAVIAYYYRHKDDATRWACSHNSTSDRCMLKVEDGELEVSGLEKLANGATGASRDEAARGQYGLEVHFTAGKAPLAAELLKSHLLLPDDSVLTPSAVTEIDEVADMGRQQVAIDPQLIPAQQQRTFELRFPLGELPDAYMLSLAPLVASGKQHSPPLLAMRIEYGPD